MLAKLRALVKNPKVQKAALAGASLAAGAYAGPGASAAVTELLPKLAQALGLL